MSEKKTVKTRPSLKNFLSTGKVELETEVAPKVVKPPKPPKPEKPKKEKKPKPEAPANDFSWLLKKLAPDDLAMWEGMLNSGAGFEEKKIDFIQLRDMFRTMDRVQFTLYMLQAEGTPMRTIRSGVQIRDPFEFFLLWDDNGAATVYR